MYSSMKSAPRHARVIMHADPPQVPLPTPCTSTTLFAMVPAPPLPPTPTLTAPVTAAPCLDVLRLAPLHFNNVSNSVCTSLQYPLTMHQHPPHPENHHPHPHYHRQQMQRPFSVVAATVRPHIELQCVLPPISPTRHARLDTRFVQSTGAGGVIPPLQTLFPTSQPPVTTKCQILSPCTPTTTTSNTVVAVTGRAVSSSTSASSSTSLRAIPSAATMPLQTIPSSLQRPTMPHQYSNVPTVPASTARMPTCDAFQGVPLIPVKRAIQTPKGLRDVYVCPFLNCTRLSSEHSNMKAHLRLHTGERPYICRVASCHKSFRWKSSLTYHERALHSNSRPYHCGACRKSFVERRKLRLHHQLCPVVRRAHQAQQHQLQQQLHHDLQQQHEAHQQQQQKQQQNNQQQQQQPKQQEQEQTQQQPRREILNLPC